MMDKGLVGSVKMESNGKLSNYVQLLNFPTNAKRRKALNNRSGVLIIQKSAKKCKASLTLFFSTLSDNQLVTEIVVVKNTE